MAPVTLSGEQIEEIRQRAARAIAPLKPPDAGKRYVMGSARTKGGRALPRHYFVYFLLVELLKFPHTGQEEKVAWTIPVAYGDDFAFVEYRKMGLGIFSKATAKDEGVAKDIVAAIKRGVGASVPFFDHLAAKAVESSLLNVTNNSDWLFNRYEYLRDQFRERIAEAQARKDEVKTEALILNSGTRGVSYSYPAFDLRREAAWVGIAAIEAFLAGPNMS